MSFRVMAQRCDQCLFSPERIVSSQRMTQLLQTCARDDTHFVCHKSTIAEGREGNVCCRGFYDLDPGASNLMRIAGRLGCIEFVQISTSGSPEPTPETAT